MAGFWVDCDMMTSRELDSWVKINSQKNCGSMHLLVHHVICPTNSVLTPLNLELLRQAPFVAGKSQLFNIPISSGNKLRHHCSS